MSPIVLLIHCKRGVTSLEYGVIASVIVASGIYGFSTMCSAVSALFTAMGNSL